MMTPPLSQRIAAALVRSLAPAVPASFRARWREEWLAEIGESAPGRRVIWRAAGAWRDVLACRRHFAPGARETAAFGLRGLGDDLRYSARAIRRSPGFTVAAVASLSIGIAATTTVFSAVNALLFRSLPGVQDSTRLVQVFTIVSGAGGPSPEASYRHYRDTLTSLSGVAGFAPINVAIGTSTEASVGVAVLVTTNYFELLGTPAAAGRLLDSGAGTQAIAVASHGLAVREFESAAAAIGQTLSVNGVPLEIVGVTPPSFIGVRAGGFGESAGRPQLWLSHALRPLVVPQRETLVNRGAAGGNGSWLEVVGRLAPGVSVAQANAQATSLPPHAIATSHPNARVWVGPLGRGPRDTTAMVATAVAIALGIPFIVLAIGCANTANLQLARAARRQTEIAVKRSLGATRGVIVRQLLIESVFVAALAGTLAILGTVWATRVLEAYLPVPCPVDWRVLVFALGVVLVTGIGFGMAPALSSTRGSLTTPLKDSGGNAVQSRSRLRGALVVAQVTLSILLLVLAGLFTRSLQNLQGVGTDRDMAHVAAATVDLGLLKYPEARGRVFQEELLGRIERTPGVVAAAIAPFEPFGGNPGLIYRAEDHTGPLPYLYTNGGAPLGRFVETAGLRVIRGRGFADADRTGAPNVALVSEALARRISPSGDVVGRRLLVADGITPNTPVTIVGITADSALRAGRGEAHAMFLPSPLNYDSHFTLWVRTTGEPSLVLPAIRQIVRDLDPQLPIRRLGTADSWRAQEIQPIRWVASGLGAMGMLAVLLAGAGLYAVMSYLVANRRHEMAVRLALGATPSDLSRLIVAQALRLSVPGLALGVFLAAIAARIARAMLLGVSPLDPIAFGGVAVLLTAVAVTATLVPALRAARLDPLATLRRQ
jgi:predicted permease